VTFHERDRGRAARRLLIVFVVIVGLLVALDRIGNAVAERLTADTIQSNQHLPKRPDVNITGFPFLSQLATGNFDEIIITDNDVPVGGSSSNVHLSTIRVALHRVHVARTLSSVHAVTADAAATMSFRDLGRALGGVRITYDGGGRVTAAKSITILGHRISGAISARPMISNDTLSFGQAHISNVNQLIAGAAALLAKVFAVHLPLGGIPFDVRVRSLHVDKSGLHLALVGHNLSYSR
jgi:DUF2993 family protein